MGMSMEIRKLDNSFNSLRYNNQQQSFSNFKSTFSVLKDDYKKPIIENDEDESNTKVKVGVISAAILSTLGVMYGITKQKKLNPLKDFNMFKQIIEPMDMLKITGVTVPVSLATGIALDKKENRQAKVKEGISQMVGNLIIPIFLVDQSIKLKDKLDLKQFKNPIMNGLKKTHKAIYTAVALVTGLMIGNRVANGINSSVFEGHKSRPLKIQDFSAHFDDVCFATSLIFKDNPLGKIASRFIPATLLVSAYETGTKTKNEN